MPRFMETKFKPCLFKGETAKKNLKISLMKEVKGSKIHSVVSDCDPMDYTVRGILQARILEWVAFPFSKRSSQPRDRTQVSCIVGRFFTS